jgi:FtsZ-interacting cell division protein YlmF
LKFCPECGSQLPIGTAKFCSNCGNNLWTTALSSETDITVESKKQEKDTISYRNSFEKFGGKEQQKEEEQQQIKGEFQNQTTHSLGIKLEDTVVQILENRGYSTEMRRKLVGSSGAIHEIDVLARRQQQSKVLAVECKNYSEARVVGIKEETFRVKYRIYPKLLMQCL